MRHCRLACRHVPGAPARRHTTEAQELMTVATSPVYPRLFPQSSLIERLTTYSLCGHPFKFGSGERSLDLLEILDDLRERKGRRPAILDFDGLRLNAKEF